jgi:anti-sigma B factor antagonist
MRDSQVDAEPVVVTLPDEVDITNADSIGEQLRAAFGPGVAVVVADLTATEFCDSSGIRNLMGAHDAAVASDAQLRLVVRAPAVQRVLSVMGLDQLLRIYPSLDQALAAAEQ